MQGAAVAVNGLEAHHAHEHGRPGEDTIYYLRLAPYLANLSDAQIEALRAEVREVAYAEGEIVFREGGPAPGLCLIKEGRVRIFRTSRDGTQEQTLRIIRPGEPFNDVPIFDGGPNPTSAEAIEPTTLLILPEPPLLQLMKQNPAVAIAVTKVLAQRLRLLSGMVDDLLFD
jgi:CRP/FNR family transcriptional regulator